ncbi:hypothetical protein D3C76_1449870 [compost metagenome]
MCLTLFLLLKNLSLPRLTAQLDHLLGYALMDTAFFLIGVHFRRHPLGRKRHTTRMQNRTDLPVRFRNKSGNDPVAGHKQCQRRCLHPAY